MRLCIVTVLWSVAVRTLVGVRARAALVGLFTADAARSY